MVFKCNKKKDVSVIDGRTYKHYMLYLTNKQTLLPSGHWIMIPDTSFVISRIFIKPKMDQIIDDL